MEQRQQELNSLAQMSMGRSFGHGRDSDLRLIQEILDRKLVKKDEIAKLQAMGIIMGEHLRRENGLRWVIAIGALVIVVGAVVITKRRPIAVSPEEIATAEAK